MGFEGGWLGARGALDFAGGTVVHISSGTSALVAAVMLGKRRGYGRDPMPPHNVPFVVIGAALLWVGWFGFNAGSALAADGIATVAFVNTNTATGAAVLGWMASEWIARGKPTAVGLATGAVAGLVAITPAAGFVEPWAAILIGGVAGYLCYQACSLKHRFGYDDALDVVGVHGVGGTWGAIATGMRVINSRQVGDVVDQPDDHSGRPDAGLHVAILEDVAAPGTGDERREVVDRRATRALTVDDLLGDAVPEDTGSVPQRAKDQRGISLVGLDHRLLDVVVYP